MRVTGICNICGKEKENTAHALFSCLHARQLWESMRGVWLLPYESDMKVNPFAWFSIIIQAPVQMVDNIFLVAWRAWHARNEVTHEKPLPSIEGAKRFLCSYLKSVKNARELSPKLLLKESVLHLKLPK
jgi:hypothetical protein